MNASRFILRSYQTTANDSVPPADRQQTFGRVVSAGEQTAHNKNNLTTSVPSNEYRFSKVGYESAHDLSIVQVARAATAATTYHKPQRVRNARDEEMIFEDAGLVMNNPTQVGIREVDRKHNDGHLGVIVSVGTAKGKDVVRREAGKTSIIGATHRGVDLVTDPEPVHLEVQNDCQKKGISYFRLNPLQNDEAHKLGIIMDEWKPKSNGHVTLKAMKRSFNRWYQSDASVKATFTACAEKLVGRRRSRVKEDFAKWDRYVTGSHFQCHLSSDCMEKEHTFSDQFLHHVKSHDNRQGKTSDSAIVEHGRSGSWKYQDATTKAA